MTVHFWFIPGAKPAQHHWFFYCSRCWIRNQLRKRLKAAIIDPELSPRYHPGDMLWAKVGGHPFWPCMVSHDPFDHLYYKQRGTRHCFCWKPYPLHNLTWNSDPKIWWHFNELKIQNWRVPLRSLRWGPLFTSHPWKLDRDIYKAGQ